MFSVFSFAQEESALTVETGWITCKNPIIRYDGGNYRHKECIELNLDKIDKIEVALYPKIGRKYNFFIIEYEKKVLCNKEDMQKGRKCALIIQRL